MDIVGLQLDLGGVRPERPVVSAVEILDADLNVVAQDVVWSDRPCAVELPPSDRYLARARLVSGEQYQAVLRGGQLGETVFLRPAIPQKQYADDEDDHDDAFEVPGVDGWAVSWLRVGEDWRPSDNLMIRASRLEGFARATFSAAANSSLMLQVGGDRYPTLMTVVPFGADVLIAGPGPHAAAGWMPTLPSGLGAALLGYLHQGDWPSAGAIADALSREDSQSPLDNAALGYHAAAQGDFWRLDRYCMPLIMACPDAADTAVLSARLELSEKDANLEGVRSLLLRAASAVPAVASGMRLLFDLLSWLSRRRSDGEVDRALQYVRTCLDESVSSPLTAFGGTSPSEPGRAVVSPRPATSMVRGFHLGVVESAPTFVPFHSAARLVTVDKLDKMLNRLRDLRSVEVPRPEEVIAGYVRLKATADDDDLFTVKLSIDESLGLVEPGTYVRLRSESNQHHIARFNGRGEVVFHAVPQYDWQFDALEAADEPAWLPGRSISLPITAEEPAAAGPEPGRSREQRILLPSLEIVLSGPQGPADAADASLWVVADQSEPAVLPLGYTTLEGAESVVLLPLDPEASRRDMVTGAIRLPRMDMHGPWFVSDPVRPLDLDPLEGEIHQSVTLASKPTRGSWQAIARLSRTPLRQLIESVLREIDTD
jgi:hypothetical protein